MQDKHWNRLIQQKNELIREICTMALDNKRTVFYFTPALECKFIGKVSAVSIDSADKAKANVTDYLANTPNWFDITDFPVEAVGMIRDAMADYFYPSLEERIEEIRLLPLEKMVEWINGHIGELFPENPNMLIHSSDDDELWKLLITSRGARKFAEQVIDDFVIDNFVPRDPYLRVDSDFTMYSYSSTPMLWDDYGNAIVAYLKRTSPNQNK